ncbi:hypothetical protein [Luteibacter sp. 22Crub2.1]|uniref:hypothetical protein n=1 Tax=Luteibacter sp. 22Crub2.1 TaxID=1283288 RepID=UPI0009A84DC4|nr:hypothetical protein [Luteibacter sp. 22Crub2.1]SKB59731.1 hypothetical protein SAMN05660880_01762 [Luteibacter sp. 22Crub2.1]
MTTDKPSNTTDTAKAPQDRWTIAMPFGPGENASPRRGRDRAPEPVSAAASFPAGGDGSSRVSKLRPGGRDPIHVDPGAWIADRGVVATDPDGSLVGGELIAWQIEPGDPHAEAQPHFLIDGRPSKYASTYTDSGGRAVPPVPLIASGLPGDNFTVRAFTVNAPIDRKVEHEFFVRVASNVPTTLEGEFYGTRKLAAGMTHDLAGIFELKDQDGKYYDFGSLVFEILDPYNAPAFFGFAPGSLAGVALTGTKLKLEGRPQVHVWPATVESPFIIRVSRYGLLPKDFQFWSVPR